MSPEACNMSQIIDMMENKFNEIKTSPKALLHVRIHMDIIKVLFQFKKGVHK